MCQIKTWPYTIFILKRVLSLMKMSFTMRLCHPPDGSTSPKYKLLYFITTKIFCKEKNTLAFNRDRCCHLVLCLQLIPFHYNILFSQKRELLILKNCFNFFLGSD
jgi:hypothetical protein